jgi:hypothetical protein
MGWLLKVVGPTDRFHPFSIHSKFRTPPTSLVARRYLDAFAYGARLVHATSRNADPAADLDQLFEERSREMVVMGYPYILRQLLGYVSQALPVILHNVDHWIGEHGCATCPHTRNDQLFGN